MIWYILYPLRGTTEAPVLPLSHPLHNGFARYGRYAARHVVTTLLVSAAVGTAFICPIPFLFTNDFINGASNIPHHVWTVAQPLPYDTATQPDIIMRSAWIHASYMQALDRDILLSALELQDELLGITRDLSSAHAPAENPIDANDATNWSLARRDAIHIAHGLTNQSWFFHSPLLYWGCSPERISADKDIISTVNEKKNQSTSANVTLRHSIVFSGKRFEDRRLLAADALVITLLHLRDSPVGRRWEEMALSLAGKVGDRWDMYPSTGHVSSSQLYEFQFLPMSAQDTVVLAVAYGLAFFYFLMSISKLRAVKSKVGLMVTVITQIAFSVMSSFTVCAIFNIDLSRIPRAVYPLVILAMSLENIFRLINAVILTQSEDQTSNRIGQAFGQTAHIALASTAQNVVILSCLSRIVSPGVAAFCVFAAVAIVFDFFYLSTFFLSVLSVDVRRTELGEALAKATMLRAHRTTDSQRSLSWVEQTLQGKIAISTRIAGTIIIVGFVLVAQWHFFGDETMLHSFFRLHRETDSMAHDSLFNASTLKNIHQARSPTSWLRLQDHETAREVINIVKPWSYSYIARVYEPLVFVRKNSNRIPPNNEPTLLPAAYDFVRHQLKHCIVFIIIVIAGLRLLASYLLWGDEANSDITSASDEQSLISVKSLGRGHALDVAMLAYSPAGCLVSVGLDRKVRVWDVRGRSMCYEVPLLENGRKGLFPIVALAIDRSSQWLALLTSSRQLEQLWVTSWDLTNRRWGKQMAVESECHGLKPEAFFFDPAASTKLPRVFLVQKNGSVTAVTMNDVGGGKNPGLNLFNYDGPIRSASPLLNNEYTEKGDIASKLFVVAVTRTNDIVVACQRSSAWYLQTVSSIVPAGQMNIYQIVALSPFGMFLAAAIDSVHLIDASDGTLVYTFKITRMQPRSLQSAHACHPSTRPGYAGLTSLTICYIEEESGDCIMHSFAPPEESHAICLSAPSQPIGNTGWCAWNEAVETQKRIRHPGHWNTLTDGSTVGIRESPHTSVKLLDHAKMTLRNRLQRSEEINRASKRWEVWTALPSRRSEGVECQPLLKEGGEDSRLMVSGLGPTVKVGLMSVAFGFGNSIKLVTVGGMERFDDTSLAISSRRRKATGSNRSRAWT